MEKASFSIKNYKFTKVNIDLDLKQTDDILVDFKPSGKFNSDDSTYELIFDFIAVDGREDTTPFVSVRCIGLFEFENVTKKSEIPSFFYSNSIALLFPYLRAFVSIITIQANIKPIILPTMNLASLENVLREKTE